MNKYPSLVCVDCGRRALKNFVAYKSQYKRLLGGINATFHKNKCDVCKEIKPVTEARDFHSPPLVCFEFKQ